MTRTILLLTAAAMLAASPASAGEIDDRAEWIDTLIWYDRDCESLGYGFKEAAINALGPIPRQINLAALDRLADFRIKVGDAKFCELTKARIAANHQWKFQAR